jgi:SAM-dependent methyltransferase
VQKQSSPRATLSATPKRLLSRLDLFSHFFSSLRRRGLLRTVKIAWWEFYYQHRFGGSTGLIIKRHELDGEADALAHSVDYFPSSYLILNEIFVRGPIDCRDRVVVDFGCGLGRALMFMSTLPFRTIVGVEFAPTLAAAARSNLERLYARENRTTPAWSVVNADARTFPIPADATLFYFFNPFDASVLGKVLDNIIESARRNPRICTIVYANPVHAEEMKTRQLPRLPWPANDFAIFTVGGDVQAPQTDGADNAVAGTVPDR